jgi:hypothetical protein
MSNRKNSSPKSPWFNSGLESLLNTEFSYCSELKNNPTLTVNQAIKWVYQHGNETKLRGALDEFAPLIQIDHPHAETWVSPPASGAGNTVVIVSGFDASGEIRTVGGNWCTRPGAFRTVVNFQTFFEQFDKCTNNTAKTDLLQDALDVSVRIHGSKWAEEVHEWCRVFRTMPIHMIALTSKGPLLATFPAVVHGARFCDFSLEKVRGI